MAEPTRKSTRKRVKNTRYSEDVVEAFQEILGSDSDEALPVEVPADDSEEDEDFDLDQTVAEPSSESDEMLLDAEADSSGKRASPIEIDDAVVEGHQGRKSKVKITARKSVDKRYKYKQPALEDVHVRGIAPNTLAGSKSARLEELAGDDPSDQETVLREKKKWINFRTLPFRSRRENQPSAMDYPSVSTNEQRNAETKAFKEWYIDERGQEKFQKLQAIDRLDSTSTASYLIKNTLSQRTLLGPYGSQKIFNIPAMQTVSLQEAQEQAEIEANIDPEQRCKPQSWNGWLLNLGDKIRCLDWAPNHHSERQYLAVATCSDPPPEYPRCSAFEPLKPYKANFTLWSFKSRKEQTAQLMDLDAKPRLDAVLCTDWGAVKRLQWCPSATPDTDTNGHGLIGLLAGVWSDGYARLLEIRIPPPETRPNAVNLLNDNGWAEETSTSYMKINSVAFASKPPDTICTCVSWLSATHLAVGCANGCLAVWNIAKHINSTSFQQQRSNTDLSPDDAPNTLPPAPNFYLPLHPTYILSVSALPISTSPFSTPHVVTVSADGRARLTSLAHPHTDSVFSFRQRRISNVLAYSPHLLSMIIPDDHNIIRILPLRQFYASRSVAKGTALVTALDAGKCHPSVLIGCADGTCIASNPVRRLFMQKEGGERGPGRAWSIKWFQSEFLPDEVRLRRNGGRDGEEGREDGIGDEGEEDNEMEKEKEKAQNPKYPFTQPIRKGISRQLSSFRIEPMEISKSFVKSVKRLAPEYPQDETPKKKRAEAQEKETRKDTQEGQENEGQIEGDENQENDEEEEEEEEQAEIEGQMMYDTLYEEESAVTCVGWNPNPATGGWAAAGLGTGIVRVEDLAL